MNKMIKKVAISTLMLGMPLAAFAAPVDQMKNPWTHCGIGAMIFQETQWAAVTSNIIWDLGTTAVTSAAASPNLCSGKDVVAARFITENYANIEEETVKGDGKHLNAMLNILECDASVQPELTRAIRSELSNVIREPAYQAGDTRAKAETYYNVVNSKVAGVCKIG